MAHQTHALPWQTLADNFKFVYAYSKYNGRTNLYPRFKPGQGKQLQHFARVFARQIEEFSTQERKNYPYEIVAPADDEIFIPDVTVKRISKTVKDYKTTSFQIPSNVENLRLSDDERRIPFWLTNIRNDSYPTDSTRECSELLKTLLLYGEMEPLLRLAAHPKIHLGTIWTFPWDSRIEYGWCELKDCALTAYLCLNMFLLKPELYDPTCRTQKFVELKKMLPSLEPDHLDYRLTAAYQKTFVGCVYSRYNNKYDVCSYPHREFFGVESGMVTLKPFETGLSEMLGRVPLSEFLEASRREEYVPSHSDILTVIGLLRQKNLPAELSLQILEDASYSAKRRVPVANDPLHPENGEELKKYLSYCWKVLIRIDLLLKANGQWIDWENEVTDCIYDLWGVRYPTMCKLVRDWEDEWVSTENDEKDVDRCRTRRTFI